MSPEARRDQIREEDERAEVHPLDWPDDFGPLQYTDFTTFVLHMQQIEHAQEDQAKEHALALKHGYRDVAQFRRVRWTFLKYWGKAGGSRELRCFSWKEPEFSQALMGMMQLERDQTAREALAANPGLAAPEEGLTLEQYASLCARIAGRDVPLAELQQMLAVVGCDVPKWERVNKAWSTRMGRDATGTITALFTKAFTGAGAGQFGAAAQAASASMSGGPGAAPAGPEPLSLDKYAEIGALMGVWVKQGKDSNAMLLQQFNMSSGDLSNVSMYWHQRFSADITLLGRYGQLQDRFQKLHALPDPDADLVY